MYSMLKFPFARVDGIERNERIATISIKNFKKLNITRTNIYIGDAKEFEHYHRYNMFYFYNPFPEDIMSIVIEKINQSIEDKNREIILIYYHPVCHDVIFKHGAFTIIIDYPGEWGNRINVYSNQNTENSRIII